MSIDFHLLFINVNFGAQLKFQATSLLGKVEIVVNLFVYLSVT